MKAKEAGRHVVREGRLSTQAGTLARRHAGSREVGKQAGNQAGKHRQAGQSLPLLLLLLGK